MLKSFLHALFVIIPLLYGCKIDRDKPVNREKFTFIVEDDAELFFRNVRQIYYDRSSPDGTWQAYRISDRYTGNERPIINPVIVINWLRDEAYLLIDTNEPLNDEDFLRVAIRDQATSETDTITLKERGRERMLEFGSQLYESIMAGQEISIQINGVFQPIFTEQIDREAFRITIADYYRLTRIF